ncbi:MAG TPA: hypothetical protein VD998_00330 [Verrucomicrobiae bacterium]|nr:hypothetical protein [Verrucomicrobiae bacterium]
MDKDQGTNDREEQMYSREGVWIKYAGNARHIKANLPHHWRIYVADEPSGILIDDLVLIGEVNRENFRPETNTQSPGLVAWINIFGDVEVKDHIATIRLKQP